VRGVSGTVRAANNWKPSAPHAILRGSRQHNWLSGSTRRNRQGESVQLDDAVRFSAIEPDECQTIEEIREGIDEIDHVLLDLLVRRQAYTVRAAKIKKDAGMAVRDEDRLAQQIARAKALGAEKGLSPLLVEPLFTLMIEQHIKFETMLHERGS